MNRTRCALALAIAVAGCSQPHLEKEETSETASLPSGATIIGDFYVFQDGYASSLASSTVPNVSQDLVDKAKAMATTSMKDDIGVIGWPRFSGHQRCVEFYRGKKFQQPSLTWGFIVPSQDACPYPTSISGAATYDGSRQFMSWVCYSSGRYLRYYKARVQLDSKYSCRTAEDLVGAWIPGESTTATTYGSSTNYK